MSRFYIGWLVVMLAFSCNSGSSERQGDENGSSESQVPATPTVGTSLIVLGTIQDAGSPHIGCKKECCADLFDNPDPARKVVALGLFDELTGKKYLIEATPDMPVQMKMLKRFGAESEGELADGIFITHAHIGHYTGLMYLGKEATNSRNVPVYVMPEMSDFITGNAPWNLLVTNGNIVLQQLENETAVKLSDHLEVTPFLVPHRDEMSETVGFLIKGPEKKALFIPDIDKWEKWKSIIDEIKGVDYAFLDATFYSGEEINRADISQIPHPFIIESLELFGGLSIEERQKIYFLHFNHTNPVLDRESKEAKYVLEQGFRLAGINEIFGL
jgi:pyrroloquinoline quinone biosynthesis protein B